MSAQINNGGPAFPQSTRDVRRDRAGAIHEEHGMTLRDYFAAKAMQAYLSSYPQGVIAGFLTIDDIAADAWDVADAMLAERVEDGEA